MQHGVRRCSTGLTSLHCLALRQTPPSPQLGTHTHVCHVINHETSHTTPPSTTPKGKFDRDIGQVSAGDGFQKVYIHVSPLTLWTVEIPRGAANPDVDFTNVTSLSLFFRGSVIPTSSAGLAVLSGARCPHLPASRCLVAAQGGGLPPGR